MLDIANILLWLCLAHSQISKGCYKTFNVSTLQWSQSSAQEFALRFLTYLSLHASVTLILQEYILLGRELPWSAPPPVVERVWKHAAPTYSKQ